MPENLETSSQPTSQTLQPPRTIGGMLLSVGPGLIVAGSIVGSGELIATTKTGAEAGFSLLWLIVLGCLVKVFVQIELGRITLITGQTTLKSLDQVPGPRIQHRGNWLVWFWMVMWLASISQQGGIVGGVGQAMAISMPITAQGRAYNEMADAVQLERFREFSSSTELSEPAADGPSVAAVKTQYKQTYGTTEPPDTLIWAAIVSVLTSIILWFGRYGLIQSFSTVLVGSFTLLTFVNLFLLQGDSTYQVTWEELAHGFSFSLPSLTTAEARPIATALATFGIIGVGAAELVAYPYWCLEKGYAKFTGPYEPSTQWQDRAAGWMRVMRVDAWGSMVVYTFATIAFYLLGAAVLHRIGLNPSKSDMVRTLAVMFVPVFSSWASMVFLFGAFAVLYSTFFVACASHARVFSDALRVVNLIADDESTRDRWVRWLSGLFPMLSFLIYVAFPSPAQLVLLSGVAQGVMLPMLAAAAIHFRYRRGVDGLRPGKLWDLMLWLSALAMLITGIWTIVSQFE